MVRLYDSATGSRPAILLLVAALATSAAAGQARDDTATAIRFADVTETSGVDFVHFSGRSVEKHMPETMGGGVAWLDFDLDGRGDLYLVDSGLFEDIPPLAAAPAQAGRNLYYRGGTDRGFERAASGAENSGFGMGVAAGDFDHDGYVDLYVTNYGADALYRNNGDGTFADVTAEFGLGDERWGTSAAWADLDLDGLPELFVVNYLVYSQAVARACGDVANDRRSYCTPDLFDGVEDILYRNLGGAAFVDAATTAGVANALDGKGLGIVIADLDRDDLPDLYVANDATRNFVFMNRGNLEFEDVGLMSGAGLGIEGLPQSGMGVEVGDLDGDGIPEIGVTNYEQQPVNMYRALLPGLYSEDSYTLGVGGPTAMTLGFGILFVDADGDGDLDVFVANGHALDMDDWYAQPNQVFDNQHRERANGGGTGPLLRDVSRSAGPAMSTEAVSRGMVAGDLDRDGWPDLIATNIDAAPQVLRNAAPRENRRLVVRLRGRSANRDAFGARLTVITRPEGSDVVQYLESKSSTSYVSQSMNELYVGLGAAETADLHVRWPGGEDERIGEVAAGQVLLLVQGRGIVASRSLESSE
jgi:hypothetical protein